MNADEFSGENPTNEPARLWVQPYGAKSRNSDQLVRLGRRYLVYQLPRVARAGGRSALCWPGDRSGGHGDACERLQVQRAILPGKMAHPSLRDLVLSRTLADFQAGVPAKITLVNEDGVLVDTGSGRPSRPPAPIRRPGSADHQQCSSAARPQCCPGRLLEGGERERQQLPDSVVAGHGRIAQPFDQGRAIWALTGVTRCSQ
jgi:hypothetical protein